MTCPQDPHVHINGCMRSGTTWIEALIRDHTTLEATGNGKHGVHVKRDPDCPRVVVVRDPAAWLPSYLRYTYYSTPFTQPEAWYRRLAHGTTIEPYRAVRALRNWAFKTYTWLNTHPHDKHTPVLARYRDVLQDPGAWLLRLVHLVGGDVIRKPEITTDRADPWVNGTFDPTYYLEEQYLHEWTPEVAARVVRMLDEREQLDTFWELGHPLENLEDRVREAVS